MGEGVLGMRNAMSTSTKMGKSKVPLCVTAVIRLGKVQCVLGEAGYCLERWAQGRASAATLRASGNPLCMYEALAICILE